MSHSVHKNPTLASDAILTRLNPITQKYEILMIERGHPPFVGSYAFPGGHVEYGEDPKDACFRELMEECNLEGKDRVLIDVAGAPNRDPREHVISVIFAITVKDISKVKAGDDAVSFAFLPLEDLLAKKHKLAFDHQEIIEKYYAWFKKEGEKIGFFSKE